MYYFIDEKCMHIKSVFSLHVILTALIVEDFKGIAVLIRIALLYWLYVINVIGGPFYFLLYLAIPSKKHSALRYW